MNIKIAKTMLILCVVYMIGFYILKFIFPEQLLLVVTDPNIIHFGTLVQERMWATHIVWFISTFTSYYLFSSACRGSFKLNWKQLIILLVATTIDFCAVEFFPDLLTHTSISLMLLIALLFKGKMSYTVISFVIHGYLSQFLFSIRGFDTIILMINPINAIVFTMECWVWMVLLALIFYLKEKKNGSLCSTISQQDGR